MALLIKDESTLNGAILAWIKMDLPVEVKMVVVIRAILCCNKIILFFGVKTAPLISGVEAE